MPTKVNSGITTQLIATAGAVLLMNQIGFMAGWTTPNMTRLTQPNAMLSLTLSEASWLVSFFHLGKFASAILALIFIELAGSRQAILYTFGPVAMSWMLTMLANSATWLYIAKFLSGTGDGLTVACDSLFLGEVSSSMYRGTFTAIALIGKPLGAVAANIAEAYLPSVSCAIYMALCLLGMLLLMWLPDLPYHLVKDQRMSEAVESLTWYRGHSEVDEEMQEIIEFVESTGRLSLAERMRQLRSAPVRKAMLLVVLVNVLPQVCGVVNVICYMQIILTDGKFYLIDPSQVAIYVSSILLVTPIVTINLIDKLGRRVLLITFCTVMTTALLGLGLHFDLLNNFKICIQSLPVTSIIIFLVAYSIGLSPVADTLLGEMFPAGIKSTAAMIITYASALSGFVSTKTYQPLIDAIAETYVFWMYAAFMTSAIIVFLFSVPEMKGKSLQEIQNDLNKKP